MTIKIRNITIEAFRGIRCLDISLEGKGLVVLGENGTGKSSIADALEFFFTNKVSHLHGIQGLSVESHAPHVHYKPEDTKISLIFNVDNRPLEKIFGSEIQPSDRLKEYCDVTRKGTFILRRSQILKFIITRPAERFSELANIMGLGNLINEIELEMMRARDSFKGKLDGLKKDRDELTSKLSSVLELEIKNEDGIVRGLNQKLAQEQLPAIQTLDEIEKLSKEFVKKVRQPQLDNGPKLKLNQLSAVVSDQLISTGLGDNLNKYIAETNAFLLDNSGINSILSLEKFLSQGTEVLKNQSDELCPMCEQSVDINDLKTRVQSRLTTLKNLTGRASELRQIGESLRTQVDSINKRLSELIDRLKNIDELSTFKGELENHETFLTDSIKSIKTAINMSNTIPILDYINSFSQIESSWIKIRTEIGNLIKKMELSEEEENAHTFIRLLEQVKNLSESLHENETLSQNLKHQHSLAETIYKTFAFSKNCRVQQIYDSIQSDIARFYDVLHPDEPYKNIKLEATKRASTNLTVETFGRPSEDPRALSSEGHLDSLGLCIFLGFVKNFNSECSLVILDDIVTTIDSAHRERICKLLFEEFPDKQFIITTHDGIWYEQLCAYQRAYDLTNDFKNVKIIKWSLGGGPTIENHKIQSERIDEKIEKGEKKEAGNLSRQHLEYILLNLAARFEVEVKIKMSMRYDVGDLFDPVENRFKKLLKNGDKMKTVIETAFQNLRQTFIMGNLLSHNNEIAENISIQEVKRFWDAVKNLEKVLQCMTCSKPLLYLQQAQLIRCGNGKCKDPQQISTN